MDKIDLKRELKNLYTAAPSMVSVVDVPPMHFLMIDGHGDPNTAPEYRAAVEALYGLTYPLGFRLKKDGRDYRGCRSKGYGGPRTCANSLSTAKATGCGT